MSPPPTPLVPSDVRTGIGTVAVVAASAPPRLNLEVFPKTAGSAAGRAAWETFAACAGAGGGGGGDFAALAYVLWFAICAGAAGVSAGIAAHQQPGPETAAASLATLRAAATRADTQSELADHVMKAMAREPWPRLAHIDARASREGPAGYAALHAAGVDHVVEVGVSEVATVKFAADELILTRISVHARLVRTGDQAEVFAGDYRYTSEPHKPAEWVQDDAAWFRNTVDNAYDAISTRIRDAFFFVHPFPYTWYNKSGWSWFTGLQAESPGESGTVNTAQPTLRWEAFPRAKDRQEAPQDMARVEKVAYDLRIAEQATGKVIYERDGLPANSHTVAIVLRANETYRWTVRARFELDGHRYVTDWASAGGAVGETAPFNWYSVVVKSN